ncbi:hypothetical protein I7I53_08296 [Histoplasma capsulatum var. duboisii H88]|uniref:Uncharacterized protein n=1 Tax=Ajellomyces capsulatus (strain H88) TaxID=544711 RepID=A0A8A1LJH2_AJEC8|nr:hypothetical protein I7I53_08296 [Histoplasma capsulatum var. duboisii H88]
MHGALVMKCFFRRGKNIRSDAPWIYVIWPFFPRVPIEFLQKGFENRYPKQYQQQQPPEAPAYKLSSSHPLHSHSSRSAL